VAQNILGIATRIFQGVTQDGHIGQGALFVNRLGQCLHGGGEPGGVESDRTKGVAEDVTDQTALVLLAQLPHFVLM
jgi:hypothetical protein